VVKCDGEQAVLLSNAERRQPENRALQPEFKKVARNGASSRGEDMWKCRLMTDLPYVAGCIAILMLALYL
jgi:hypothetical protein